MKPYDYKEITQALQLGSQLHLDNSARERIRLNSLTAFDTVTEAVQQRYNNYEPEKAHLSLLMLRPMIPIIIALVLLAGTTGTAVAADNAKPGDALFGVDQALETARLSFTFGDDAKSKVWVSIAEERDAEMQVLVEAGQTELAEEAEEHAARALDNALTVINRVRAEHDDQGNSSEALDDVSEKLEEVQNRFTERVREQTSEALKKTFGEVELEAEIEGTVTNVKIKINETEQHYTLTATDLTSIIESIRTRTGLSTDDIAVMLKLDRGSSSSDEADDDSDDDQANENTNEDLNDDEEGNDSDEDQNENSNANRNANTNRGNGSNGNDDEDNENVNEDNSDEEDSEGNENGNTNENETDDEEESN